MADLELFVLILPDSPQLTHGFSITAACSDSVGSLRGKILTESQDRLHGIGALDLVLWKLHDPISRNEAETAARVAALGQNGQHLSKLAIRMGAPNQLGLYFRSLVKHECIHIIVQAPALPSAGQKRGLSNDNIEDEPASKRTKRHSGPESPVIYRPEWSPRQDTVDSVLELLHKYRLVEVRGTPASGKTTLMYLLHAQIMKKVPDAQVFIERAWPKGTLKENEERVAEKLPMFSSFKNANLYFLFDSAQNTYWDWHLWWAFKNTIQGSSQAASVYAILFCRYGIKDVADDGHHAPISFGQGRVTLDRVNRGLSQPFGLLLDEAEFLDVIHRRPNLRLGDDLRDFIYSFTRGHAGATVAVLDFLLKKQGSPMLKGLTYTLEQFHQDTASFDELCEDLSMDYGIARGMPNNSEYDQAMRGLLLDGSIGRNDQQIAKDIMQKIENGYLHGFVNLDEKRQYTFASPLHQQLWSWRLPPQTDYQLPYHDLVSFVRATVSRFRPSQLDQSDRRVGSTSHRPQYQEEYHRSIHNLTRGNVQISPEYAAAAGSRPGRIDFFIPLKKWGIELTRDGGKLEEHAARFANGGAYEQWLQSSGMVDYALLDFCNAVPVQTHPGIRNLYYIVFRKDSTRVEIYNNQLELQASQESGIYPREPRSRKKANKGNSAPTSFYYSKDIQYLQHEPVLRKLREHKAFAKKLSRAMGRGEWSIAKGLEERKPVYRLDHIVKERYPTFIDALRDIDDALCLIALFATLPTSDRISPLLVENCARLYNEWQLYVIHTGSLKKVFLSIKGVYYQAVVQGETVTWIVPWQFTQAIPSDVDIRVMLTFLELYQTLLGFVFFKIYTDEGWQYPPPLDASKDERGAGIGALSVVEKGLIAQQTTISNPIPSNVSGKDVRAAIKEISSTNPTVSSFSAPVEIDTQMNDNEADEDFVAQPSKSDPNTSINSAPLPTYQSLTSANTTTSANQTSKGLFYGLTFWLSRETPRSLLEFVIRAFGGRVGWDERAGGVGSMFPPGKDETWEAVTHVIIDRPAVAGAIEQKEGSKNGEAQLDTKAEKRSTRKYVQPQWVVDCINAGTILSEDRYERGKVLPPHLSPFGEAKGAYQPAIDDGMDTGVTVSTMADTVMGGVQTDEESSSEEEVIEGEELPDEEEEDEESANEDKEEEEKRKRKEKKRQAKALKRIAEGDLALRAAELEAEAAGVEFGEFERAVKKAKKIKSQKVGTADEAMEEDSPAIAPDESAPAGTREKEMNKMMMSNKQRKLYEKMKYSERKREAEKSTLEQKRAAIQKAQKKEAKLRAREGKA